jgi:hypothetical protein
MGSLFHRPSAAVVAQVVLPADVRRTTARAGRHRLLLTGAEPVSSSPAGRRTPAESRATQWRPRTSSSELCDVSDTQRSSRSGWPSELGRLPAAVAASPCLGELGRQLLRISPIPDPIREGQARARVDVALGPAGASRSGRPTSPHRRGTPVFETGALGRSSSSPQGVTGLRYPAGPPPGPSPVYPVRRMAYRVTAAPIQVTPGKRPQTRPNRRNRWTRGSGPAKRGQRGTLKRDHPGTPGQVLPPG